MLSSTVKIILLVLLGLAALFMLKRIINNRKNTNNIQGNLAPNMMGGNANRKQDDEIHLTFQERLELSWQFLTNITEQIISKFSLDDQKKVYRAGQNLRKNGMKYQHDIDQESQIITEVVKSRVKDKNKSQGRTR